MQKSQKKSSNTNQIARKRLLQLVIPIFLLFSPFKVPANACYKIEDHLNLILQASFDNAYLEQIGRIPEKVRSFITEQEKERYKVHFSMILKQRKFSNISLLPYHSNKGWKEQSILEYDQLCKKLRRKNSKGTISLTDGVYLRTFKESDWNYRQYTEPADLIKQFLTGYPSYYLKELTWTDTKKKVQTQRIDNIQYEAMVEMAHQGKIKLNFTNWELFQQYSLDQYMLITPSLTTQQVETLAEYLPHFDIYETTGGKYLINGYMRHQMVNELRRELGWQGYEIMLYYWGMPKTQEMYDFEQMEWKIPRVLEDY